jgi:quercetin dioxygenase-like cupin family protein
MVEVRDGAGSAVPVHTNEHWDTGFYVLAGEFTFVVGDDSSHGITIVGPPPQA